MSFPTAAAGAVLIFIAGYLFGGFVYAYAGDGVWLTLEKWQTLIAGFGALGAAWWGVRTIRQQIAAAKSDTDRQIREDRHQFRHEMMVMTARERATIDRLLLEPTNLVFAIEKRAKLIADGLERDEAPGRFGDLRDMGMKLRNWALDPGSAPVIGVLDRAGKLQLDTLVALTASYAPSDEREPGEGDIEPLRDLSNEAKNTRRALERLDTFVKRWVPEDSPIQVE